MKWRPISELSDEQRDGRWRLFLFLDKDECPIFKSLMCHYGRWRDRDDNPIEKLKVTHFFSHPLPDLPKPLKMEWRRFEDELPSVGQEIVTSSMMSHFEGGIVSNRRTYNSIGVDSEYLIFIKKYKINTHNCFWMPIVPPEDE